jgi:hypothetical protein
MARGWESKSVEDQVEQQAQDRDSSATSTLNKEELAAAQAARLRQRMSLELQRDRILDERTSNPIRRAALEAALTDVEAKLAAL